jgi:hypothetical protein
LAVHVFAARQSRDAREDSPQSHRATEKRKRGEEEGGKEEMKRRKKRKGKKGPTRWAPASDKSETQDPPSKTEGGAPYVLCEFPEDRTTR